MGFLEFLRYVTLSFLPESTWKVHVITIPVDGIDQNVYMTDVFNSVLGYHFSTVTTCQILEKPHHVVLSYICFPLFPFLIILNPCCLHSSRCLCFSFFLFASTLWSGRRFADVPLLSWSELSELDFLDTLSSASTFWVQFPWDWLLIEAGWHVELSEPVPSSVAHN